MLSWAVPHPAAAAGPARSGAVTTAAGRRSRMAVTTAAAGRGRAVTTGRRRAVGAEATAMTAGT